MFLLRLLLFLFLASIVSSCNSDKTEEEMEELWSKAQTRQAIIDRSGTPFNSGVEPDLALRDAQNRLASGGGLLEKGGGFFDQFVIDFGKRPSLLKQSKGACVLRPKEVRADLLLFDLFVQQQRKLCGLSEFDLYLDTSVFGEHLDDRLDQLLAAT